MQQAPATHAASPADHDATIEARTETPEAATYSTAAYFSGALPSTRMPGCECQLRLTGQMRVSRLTTSVEACISANDDEDAASSGSDDGGSEDEWVAEARETTVTGNAPPRRLLGRLNAAFKKLEMKSDTVIEEALADIFSFSDLPGAVHTLKPLC